MSWNDRTGFTLVELLVAVLLAGLAALLAARVFDAAVEGERRLRDAGMARDREINAHRWAVAAFASMEVGNREGGSFEGEPDRVAFSTWLQSPHGWFEPRHVEIRADGGEVRAVTADGVVVLAESADSVAFDYLLEPGADARWHRAWSSSVRAPVAVRMRIGHGAAVDTGLFVTGTSP